MSDEGSRTFVDTNILVYAHDSSAGEKHVISRDRVRALWADGSGCLSIQVLQEFYVTITRKVPRPFSPEAAAEVVADLSSWHVHSPTAHDVLAAIRWSARHQVSFWDAMILVSAGALGCEIVWSEDLSAGQRYGDARVVNPLTT